MLLRERWCQSSIQGTFAALLLLNLYANATLYVLCIEYSIVILVIGVRCVMSLWQSPLASSLTRHSVVFSGSSTLLADIQIGIPGGSTTR